MRKYLLFWSCLWLVSVVCAQQKQAAFCALTKAQGLSESTNAFVYRDSKGFVWVSSIDGLNRFDGRGARVFKPDPAQPGSLYGGNIQSPFFEDRHGDIWFTTEMAINCYRRKKGNFDHYFIRSGTQILKDQKHYAFYLDDQEALWISVSDSLYTFDTRAPGVPASSKFLAPLPRAARCAMAGKPGGTGHYLYVSFWAYGNGFELLDFDPGGSLLSRATYLDHSPLVCYKVLCDTIGAGWFATSGGLLYFDPAARRKQLFPLPESKPEVKSLSWLAPDKLLLASASGVLWYFDTKKAAYESRGKVYANVEGERLGIQVKTVNITSDKFGWCSSPGNGVFFSSFLTNGFHPVLESYGASNLDFSQLFEDETGQIWGLTFKDSAFVFDGKSRLCATCKPPQSTAWYKNQLGKSCFFAPEGLFELNLAKKNWRASNIKPAMELSPLNTCVLDWSPDVLMVGTTNGLYTVQQKNGFVQKLGFSNEAPTVLYKDKKGLLWVGASDRLTLFEVDKQLSAKVLSTFEHTGMINQVSEDVLDPDRLWVATANGLLGINRKTGKLQKIGEAEGLGSRYVQSVVVDAKGRVWMGTNKGIVEYLPDVGMLAKFRLFDRRNGLSSNEYCRGAGLSASNGKLWFGGKNGLDSFHPDSIQHSSDAPQLAIVGLKIHDKEWQNDSVCVETAATIELAHNENTLRLELAAMEYSDPALNKFRVRLLHQGSDTSWVDLGTQHFITYANLRPGNYRFEFTACNADGIWQEKPCPLNLIIHPHFTQTWWFPWLIGAFLLAIISFGTAVYYRYQLRLQQLALEKQQREAERKQLLLENELALQEERNRIADEMHDELGGGLSTIRLASQRAKKVESPEELQAILKRVSQISIGLVNNMRGIIWAMDSQNDSLHSLLAYIRQYTGTFLDDNGLEATLSLPVEFPDYSLSSQYRHNVMLTVKECLNNILKHAEATTVSLLIRVDEQLSITIRDNGKGFVPVEHAGMGKGLRTTVKRMESLHGTIEWVRNPEGGMSVLLSIPLP